MLRRIHLASRSPRRRELLEQLAVPYQVLDVEVDESVVAGEPPHEYVQRVARAKADAGAAQVADAPVLGADTSVVLASRILGKPRDRDDAISMLLALSGRTHEVLSAVAMVHGSTAATRLSVSRVTFGRLSRADAKAYWDTGEPADKAGGYAIQGRAAEFIERLEGSYSGVMGLPLFETAELCRLAGIATLRGSTA